MTETGAYVKLIILRPLNEYYQSLRRTLAQVLPDAKLRLWSEFDEEARSYRQVASNNLENLVSPQIRQKAFNTARAMGRGGDARVYMVERLTEAMLMEERYKPIKVSCVARYKDDDVDWQLPRLYFVPQELQAPWL